MRCVSPFMNVISTASPSSLRIIFRAKAGPFSGPQSTKYGRPACEATVRTASPLSLHSFPVAERGQLPIRQLLEEGIDRGLCEGPASPDTLTDELPSAHILDDLGGTEAEDLDDLPQR